MRITDNAETKRTAEALLNAMRAENEGAHFYTMAARSCEDDKGRDVFTQLAQEERDHFDYLKKQYNYVLETGRLNEDLALGTPTERPGQSPIFSEALKKRIRDAHFEMTALSVGIQLERDAEAYYRKEAAATSDKVLSGLFNALAEWESGHYHALLRQQDDLKEDYWQANGFAPF